MIWTHIPYNLFYRYLELEYLFYLRWIHNAGKWKYTRKDSNKRSAAAFMVRNPTVILTYQFSLDLWRTINFQFLHFYILLCWLIPVLCWVNIAHHIVTFLIARYNPGNQEWLWFCLWILFSADNILVVMSAFIWFYSFSSLLFRF